MNLLKLLGKLLSFILSIIFFIILLLFILITFFKNTMSVDELSNYITSANFFEIETKDIATKETANIRQALEEELQKYGFSSVLIDEIIESKKVEKLISNHIIEYYNYVMFDNDKPKLVESEIYDIVNIEMIESYGNRILTKKEKDEYRKLITETVDFINTNLPEKDNFIEFNDIKYFNEIKNFIYADNFNLIVISNLILIYVLISIFNWSLYKPLKYLGTSTVFVSCFLIVIYFVEKIAIRYIITSPGTIEYFIRNLIDELAKNIAYQGFIVLIIGVLSLIIYYFFSKIVKHYKKVKKRKNQEIEVI